MAQGQKGMTRLYRWMFYLLAIFVLGAGFTPFGKTFLGLVLGSAISFYNLWLLKTKTAAVSEAVKRNETARGIGTMSRFAAVAFGVIIVIYFDDYFGLISFIIGLMTGYLVLLVDFLLARQGR